MSERDYWSTEDLWKDWHYWNRKAANSSCTPHSRNTYRLRAESSYASLTKRQPGLAAPDEMARAAVEGRGWHRRTLARRFI